MDTWAGIAIRTEKKMTERRFRAAFGVPKICALDIWESVVGSKRLGHSSPIDFLRFLYFLKVYPDNLDVFAMQCGLDSSTLASRLRKAAVFCLDVLPKV